MQGWGRTEQRRMVRLGLRTTWLPEPSPEAWSRAARGLGEGGKGDTEGARAHVFGHVHMGHAW